MPEHFRPTRRPGRKRRWVGWTLLTLGLISTVLYWASVTRQYKLWVRGVQVQCRSGRLIVNAYERSSLNDWSTTWYASWERRYEWRAMTASEWLVPSVSDWWVFSHTKGLTVSGFRGWSLVLWPFPPLFGIPGVLFLLAGRRASRRTIKGRCGGCGYDLAGLGDGVPCPECGRRALNSNEKTPGVPGA